MAVAAENTAVPLNKFTLAAVRFKVFKLVPDAVAKPSHCVDVTFVKRPETAFNVVPEAILKPNQAVEVTLAKLAVIPLMVVPDAVAYPSQPVEVTFVNVADVPVKLAIIAEDVTVKLAVTKFPVDVPPAN